ncbi:hypothetical protein [Mucilaginibacter pedocola]|uniref:Uncharacterized protein n=1 Tax=Mucilaginibacter pedocola TaxID=1792845 RepID=A0A1S9PE85_9SPHI|nr:hypothetical protein [Mucilaginibacter pedocola]OOQ59261.1 hypothetical protein BC343_28485 [Mucilaginibacter pedocola]
MDALFSNSTGIFFFFLLLGSTIVYFILRYDKTQRTKMNGILAQTQDVKPLLMAKAINHKLKAIKPQLNHENRRDIAKQLDDLVAAYDRGQVSLPEYCTRLNNLLAMVA